MDDQLHPDWLASAMRQEPLEEQEGTAGRWYADVTRYQWLVLVIASLGWVFDVFEGQIFVSSMDEVMPSLVPSGTSKGQIGYYNQLVNIAFLLGGATGGVLFGALSDRIGRTRTMVYTIVMYSAFTLVSALSQEWWHFVGLRFLVAMGVGGEWAVASAMLAEVFPRRARAWSLGIFHASSVLGTWLAIAAGLYITKQADWGWRWAFGLGVVPALLTVWIRTSLREPARWQAAQAASQAAGQRLGRIRDLFQLRIRRNTLVGVSLATIGLATFWGTHIYGKDLYKQVVAHAAATASPQAASADLSAATQNASLWGMFLVTSGGGLGLLSFGPLCERFGRRGTFLMFHLGGLASSWLLFEGLAKTSPCVVAAFLPVFGFLTLGMHAGYAIYFPELFPTRLRGSGAGFSFNMGRLLAAPILFVGGWMQKDWGFSLEQTASLLSLLFGLGLVVLLFAPETKGRELPE